MNLKHHLPLGDGNVVGKDLHVILLARHQFDNGAAAHAKQLVNRHFRGSKNHGDIDGDIVEDAHVSVRPRTRMAMPRYSL
mgnify:CR=1 FL=1